MAAGSVLAWGLALDGELGIDADADVQHLPRLVDALEAAGVVSIACGEGFTLALDEFGDVHCFGAGKHGQLGLGSATGHVTSPERVGGDLLARRVVSVAASQASAACVTDDGDLFEWGLLHYTPSGATAASLEAHGLSRSQRGTYVSERLRRLLRESERQYIASDVQDSNALGDEGVVNLRTRRRVVPQPTLCASLQGVLVAKVALGAAHAAILSRDGRVLTKGYNDRGQLGAGHRQSRAEFAPVAGEPRRCSDVVCGSSHTLALDEELGAIWAFGANAFGQLGLGPGAGEKLSPTLLRLEATRVVQVAAGDHHSLCLTEEGNILGWGHAEYGQQGSSGAHDLQYAHLTRYFHSPRPVAPFADGCVQVRTIAAAARYSLAVDRRGRLWSWGWNGRSVLGHGPGARWTAARVVEDLAGHVVTGIAAGQSHVMVLVEQCGAGFALSYKSLLPPMDADTVPAALGCDLRVSARLPHRHRGEGEAQQRASVPCHSFLVLARCPALKDHLVDATEARLPFVLAPLVLAALVEYLYCDHVRSCPPHRLVDLQHLAERLRLRHLADLCARARRQRALKMRVADAADFRDGGDRHLDEDDLDSQRQQQQQRPWSTFASDMRRAAHDAPDHDIFLAAAEDDEEEDGEEDDEASGGRSTAIPAGHTRFSWAAAKHVGPGHSAFSAGVESGVHGAHVKVLCRYPFFDRLLRGEFKEQQDGGDPRHPVVLHGLAPSGLRRLLQWMYCGDRSEAIDPATVLPVLATARCFGVDDLAKLCERFIYDRVDDSNVAYVLDFARDINNPRLIRRCQLHLDRDLLGAKGS